MIPMTMLEFHVTAQHPLDWGANPGSSIRGALYDGLRAMYDTGEASRARDDERNPVAWLLRMIDEDISGGHEAARPIAVRPPLQNHQRENSFGISLYGKGRDYLPYILSAVGAMQKIGVGRGRNQFTLKRVDQIDPMTYQASPLLDGAGKQIADLKPPISSTTYSTFAQSLNQERLCVRFLTPARIIQNKRLCHKPLFRPWFQRLLGRVRRVSELYMPEPIFVPFAELLPIAEQIALEDDRTRWQEAWSGSSREGMMRPTSGFIGEAHYSGDFSQLLPWLLIGQGLQVGKNTVKGCGWYRLDYQWQ